MQKKRNTIKIKVVGWFLLAALAVLLTGIISYNSYTELLVALENPESQQSKLNELGNVLGDISEAEAKMRAYALTRETDQLDAYRQLATEINDNLDTIKTIEPISKAFNQKIDSVSKLLSNQIVRIASFAELKSTITDLSFSAKALNEINNSADSLPSLRTTTTTTTTTTKVNVPVASSEKQRKNSKRQQRKRVQEIARELAKLENEPHLQTETVVKTDTAYLRPDTAFTNIQQLLVELDKEENQYQQLLADNELQLIESSIVIIDQIRNLISGLEKQELALNIQRSNGAKLIASRSTLTISIIIFLCLILGIIFTYLIFKDVKISDYYNRQLIGEKNQAEQLADSKQQFLANMSHEIRTPLNAIIGFSEQMTNTKLDSQQQKFLQAIHSSSHHLLNTVNDILDYSKIEAGALKIDQSPFSFKDCLQEVIATLNLKAQQKGIDLTLSIQPSEDINLLGDQFRLKQILYNLISNGIKFTDSGFVKVEAIYTALDNTVKAQIKVQDSGIGIPKEKLDEIFIDFQQVDNTTTRSYEGTGLGLAICKRLVELQQGSITVSSQPNKGSEFIVELEYAKFEGETVNQSAIADTELPRFENKKLLVIDDDPLNLQLLGNILDKWQAKIVYCNNGKEAISQIRTQSFDLVLTDINMPVMSGVEFSRALRSMSDEPDKQAIPIIALTANVMENDLERYKEAGINSFLLKPFKEADLYEVLHKHLSPQSDQSQNPTVQYHLDDFQKFSQGDKEALRPILEAFHDNLKENLKSLAAYTKNRNTIGAAEITHKMISSFGHVHALEPVNKLRELEKLLRSDNQQASLTQVNQEIQELARPVLDGLEKEIASLY